MFKNFKKFGDTKFKLKKTEFSVVKLPPMKGFSVTERIREALATTANKFEVKDGTDEENAALFFKAVLGLPPAFVEYLMDELFEYIEYSGNGVDQGWINLNAGRDMAFEGFEVINIYEVLGRALFVNFSGSFSEVSKNFPGMEQFIKQQLPKT